MRGFRTVGLCLVAAIVLAAGAAVSSASALPAYFECHKGAVGSGKYTSAKCLEEAEPGNGKYEIEEGIGKEKAFKGVMKVSAFRIPAIGGEFECKTGKEQGKVTSPTRLSKVVLTFATCTMGGKKCTSEGAKLGTIETGSLEGALGYIGKSPLKVGIDLSAESGDWADFTCEGTVWEIAGSLIGETTGNVNAFNKDTTNIYQVTGEGFQTVSSFEGGASDVLELTLNGSGPFPIGVQTDITLKGEYLLLGA
jgi:hypothetical protein